jgi:hypothetical protein
VWLSWPDFAHGWRGRSYPALYLQAEFNGTFETIILGSFGYHWWTINCYTLPECFNAPFNFLIGNLDMWGKPSVDKFNKN